MTTPTTATRAFFSFPRVDDPTRHRDYNAWHQLDHLPENLALPGVVHGQRWVRSPDCVAAGSAPDPLLGSAQYLAMYWFAEPADASIAAWRELGDTTLQQGRRPELGWTTRTALGMYRPVKGYVRPEPAISLDALPFRPNTGVYLSVSRIDEPHSAAAQDLFAFADTELIPAVLDLPGAVGAWTFRSIDVRGADGPLLRPPAALRITLCYLESDPVEFAATVRAARADGALPSPPAALTGVETELLSGPLRTIQPWRWDWFAPDPG